MTTVHDVKKIKFPTDGMLVPIELEKLIPFDVKRIFYIQGVESLQKRGKHAHIKTNQVLVCLKGSIKCICKDQHGGEVSIILSDPTTGIHVPEMIWEVCMGLRVLTLNLQLISGGKKKSLEKIVMCD